MNKIKVLDHGFVRLLNVAGPTRRQVLSIEEGGPFAGDLRDWDADDTDPANSARMSFAQRDSGRTREQDLKLVEYLLRNHHTTPIEMIETWWEMKLPIFVARQLVRHRTVSINEVSARYTTLSEEWYVPVAEQVCGCAATNKQGRAVEPHFEAKLFQQKLDTQCEISYNLYKEALGQGIAPEVARNFLHVNHYTHWLWKQDLHNVLHLLTLRMHKHAQWETQQYACAMHKLLHTCLPDIMKMYDEVKLK